MPVSSKTVPGTGLSLVPYVLLVALSVALFLFWGEPLWTARREASHVARFASSYLLVIPAGALLLAASRRLTWSHLVGATCTVWGIKLVVTSGLYFSLTGGTAHEHTAASATSTTNKAVDVRADYVPAKGDFAHGAIEGSLVQGGAPVVGAVVFIESPRPGLPVREDIQPFRITIEGSRYRGLVYLGWTDTLYEVESKDSVLHTLHLYDGGRAPSRAVMNVPVPAGGKSHPFTAPEPGIYEARCDTHESERASVVVVDHPYVARTGEAGKLVLRGVPEGTVTLVVVAPGGSRNTVSAIRRVPARVEASETTVVHIDLSTPEVAEERL